MCSFHTWFYHDSIGSVIECLHCKTIRLTFGNMQATLCVKDFEYLCNYLEVVVSRHIPTEDKGAKSIKLKTPYNGFSLLLSELELNDLYYMIEQTDIERKTAQLINLFSEAA